MSAVKCGSAIGRLTRLLVLAGITATLAIGQIPARPVYAGNVNPYYYLPWTNGVTHYTSTGNSDGPHTGVEAYAWDFADYAINNWTIQAARGGVILGWIDGWGPGMCDSTYGNRGNYVYIRHPDGAVTLYLHLDAGSVAPYGFVANQTTVSGGSLIGQSGNSGYVCPVPSQGYHLHYQVQSDCGSWFCPSQPSSFLDSSVLAIRPSGIPIAGDSLASSNAGPGTSFQGCMPLSPCTPNFNYQLPVAGGIPVVGDWTGQGKDTPGEYWNGHFYLHNSWQAGGVDIDIAYGNPGDLPLVGDWYGHGWDSVGVSRGTLIYLKGQNGLADIAFQYGSPGDTYIAGRFGGLGAPYFGQQYSIDTVGVFRSAMWYLRMSNATTNVNADIVSNFGAGTDIPVVGDWTHSGLDYIGVFRPSGATWFFATCLYCYGPGATGGWPFGTGTDYPLAGAWDGSLVGGVANVGQAIAR